MSQTYELFQSQSNSENDSESEYSSVSDQEMTGVVTTQEPQKQEEFKTTHVDGVVSLYASDDSGFIDDIMEGWESEHELSQSDILM